MLQIAMGLLFAQADPLAEHWTKLQEAWQAAGDAKGDGDYVDDKLLSAAAAIHTAFEASGLNGKELPGDRAALRRAIKARLVPAVKSRMPVVKSAGGPEDRDLEGMLEKITIQIEGQMTGGRKRVKPEEALSTLRTQAKAAAEAKPDAKAAAEEKVTEALIQLSVVEKDSAPWVKRRVARLVVALELKQPYPAPAPVTPELQARVKTLIEQLGEDDISVREKATADLVEIGEPAVPQLREACESSNAELKLRARQLLGIK